MAYTKTNPYRKKPSDTLQYAADRADIALTGAGTEKTASAGQNAYAAYLAQLQADRAAAQQRAEQLAQQKQQAAQDAYNKNMGYLASAYDARAAARQKAYQDAVAQLEAQHASGAGTVNRNADDSQQQAYINYMMQKRDTPQALTAQGLTGGMAESTIADMANNYGNNRNAIDKQRSVSLGALADTLAASKAGALQSYQKALSEDEARKMAYQIELETNLANGVSSILQAKYDAQDGMDADYAGRLRSMQTAAAKQAAAGDSAKTSFGGLDLTQTAAYKRAYRTLQSGATAEEVYADLERTNSLSASAIKAIMEALGL